MIQVYGLKETKRGTQVHTTVSTSKGDMTLTDAREAKEKKLLNFKGIKSVGYRQTVIRKIVGACAPSIAMDPNYDGFKVLSEADL